MVSEKLILGDWVKARKTQRYEARLNMDVPDFPDYYSPGFTFYPNKTFDNKIGYFKNGYFLGTISKFKITHDSLILFIPDSGVWHSYKLIKLNADSLQFRYNDEITTFKHYHVKKNKTASFDEIILSSSGCFGSCAVGNTIIKADGTVVFRGDNYTTKKGLFKGNISVTHYRELQDNFRKMDFDSLKDRYIARWTDDQTITTTFVKNGVILKTVTDYGRRSPYLFAWANVQLENLYQSISLKNIPRVENIPNFNLFTSSYVKKDNKEFWLQRSETFLLFDYLRNGKISTNRFKPTYKLYVDQDLITLLYKIDTDGRFYTFSVKGKPVTIDIGFDFFDVNIKNWKWQKAVDHLYTKIKFFPPPLHRSEKKH